MLLQWIPANTACRSEAISQPRDHAYAHLIQRLMVTGNFARLAGIDPFQVYEWYLAVYADAYERVEAPNVIGMSQFADGGVVWSKPYAAKSQKSGVKPASWSSVSHLGSYGCRHTK